MLSMLLLQSVSKQKENISMREFSNKKILVNNNFNRTFAILDTEPI